MSINKKIKNDDFITLDYDRIKDEVKENINFKYEKKTHILFHKYLKLSIVTIVVVFIGMFSIIIFSGGSNQFLKVAAASKQNVSYEDMKEEGYIEFLDKLNSFASKLSEEIYKDTNKQDNYIISPVSIYMALAMCVEGGSEEIRLELLNALGMTYEEVCKYTKILFSKLNDSSETETILGDKTLFKEIMANSIWIDDNIQLKDEGLLKLANDYHCSSYSAPFKDSNRKANKAIKDYIKDQTKGLLDKNYNISKETLFTLINTYYLKDVWNYDGDPLLFTSEKYMFNDIVETYLLQGYYKPGKAYQTDKYTSFFTITNHEIKVKFIVPNDGYSINDIYTKETLYSVNSLKDYNKVDDTNKIRYYTRCLFPEFEAEYDDDLQDILKTGFNINKFFDFGLNMTNLTDEVIKCDAVYHTAKLKVDKKGIEGAAVTVIPGAGAAGPDDYIEVFLDYIVDKNFIVIVTDSYDVPLFSGVIYNI